MAFEQTRFDRPLSRIELIFAVSIMMLLIAYAINRLLILTVEAERLAVDLTIRNMKASSRLFSADKVIRRDYSALITMQGANPVGQIIEAPRDYAGEISGYEKQLIKPGQWYYDKEHGNFVYSIINKDYFISEAGDSEIIIKLKLMYDDSNNNKQFDEDIDEPTSLYVETVNNYEWLL